MIEYILMVSIVVALFVVISAGITKIGLAKKLMAPITGPFAAVYQYGHPKAKGFDNGGPIFHPRANGEKSFRLMFNPEVK